MRIVGLFDPEIGRLTPELGERKNASNAKAREVFGWTPISAQDSLAASARSLAELGLLKPA